MKCPDCDGLGLIHIPAEPGARQRYDVLCPTCEGTGEIIENAQNWCKACGEPIPVGLKFCQFHALAENSNN